MREAAAISSYLAKPELTKGKTRFAALFGEIAGLHRTNPHIIFRLPVILLIWSLSIAAIQVFLAPHKLPGQIATTISADTTLAVATATARNPTFIPTAQHATVLDADATGQMLPPIPMAPQGSYANSYTTGECTWYVAGRRQVPKNWGNANTWYARAAADGWTVGNIPAIGAIAQTTAGSLGHVALVEQISVDYQSVYISEMNYNGRYVKSYRWVAANSFRYIYSH